MKKEIKLIKFCLHPEVKDEDILKIISDEFEFSLESRIIIETIEIEKQ